MFYRLTGERRFTRVAGFGSIDVNHGETDFEDNGVVILDYEGCRAAHTFSYFRAATHRTRRPQSFLLVGDRGRMWGSFSELFLEIDAEERAFSIPGHRYELQNHVGYAEMYDELAGVVLEGKRPYSNWQTALENMLTAHAAQLAVSENRTVTRAELRDLDWTSAFAPGGPGS